MDRRPQRLTDPALARRVAIGVRAWQKRSKDTRVSVKILAEKLKISVSQAKRAINKPRERLRRADERILFRTVTKYRAVRRKIRKDTATKIVRELCLETVSPRTARRDRQPQREALLRRRLARKLGCSVDKVKLVMKSGGKRLT